MRETRPKTKARASVARRRTAVGDIRGIEVDMRNTNRALVARWSVIGLTIVSSVLFTSPVAAGPGDHLEFLQAEVGVNGLENSQGVAVSPDGRNVYATGLFDHALVVFARDPAAGEVWAVDLHQDGIGDVDGLNGALGVAVSPDGRSVYVAGSGDDALAVFARDSQTGELSFVEFHQDGIGGVNGLDSATEVAVSPDGRSVYVTGYWDDALAVFARDSQTGELSFVEFHQDGVGSVDALDGSFAVAVSSDGRSVYVTSVLDNALGVFARDTSTGELSFVEFYQDGFGGVDGLYLARGVAVSADGRSVYAIGQGDKALAVFARDLSTGELSFVEFHQDGVGGVGGLNGAWYIAVSPDDRSVYVTGSYDDALAVFARDLSTGELSFVEFQQYGVGGVVGLSDAKGIAVSPDGRNVYSSSPVELALAVFATPVLSYVEHHQDGVGGVNGLNGANELVVSPDGRHIYVPGYYDHSVVAFGRDAETGHLSDIATYIDGVNGVDGLEGAHSVAISPDGLHAYVAGFVEDSLAVFSRNAGTGELAMVEVQRDGVGGVSGLDGPAYVRVSPDGRHVYVTGNVSDSVVAFARSNSTGRLTFIEAEIADALDKAQELVLSSDGRFVYAAGRVDDVIVIYDRDPGSGALSLVDEFYLLISTHGSKGVSLSPDGLRLYATQINERLWALNRDPATGLLTWGTWLNVSAWSVTTDESGRYVHATSNEFDQVMTFAHRAGGSLVMVDIQQDGFGGAGGLDGVRSIAQSPDGAHVYFSGFTGDSVSVFSLEGPPAPFFADGFESGDTSAWSSSSP